MTTIEKKQILLDLVSVLNDTKIVDVNHILLSQGYTQEDINELYNPADTIPVVSNIELKPNETLVEDYNETCPVCSSSLISWDVSSVEFDTSSIFRTHQCQNCFHTFEETYVISDVSITE